MPSCMLLLLLLLLQPFYNEEIRLVVCGYVR
jgi:hypothetical protein